ncbi:MAG TPA: thiamine-binding protein [Dehalococcoidia bacterium]|nr:thiamine-binding protein [Dehalococcoidia bacterium]
MIAEVECIPTPAGTESEPYRFVDAAIAVIQQSGLHYEVSALGTTLEGEPDQVWDTVRRTHEACLAAGARGLLTIVKFEQVAEGREQPTMDSLTKKFRQ